ncbi:MAG TPA: hypothetical protein VFY49_07765, partial [Myxococcota bacterium]|nr:hypothetical protein [Myxococcota bacterium]
MTQASIKGSVIVAVTDDLLKALESGRVGRDALEARLEARDLEILDAKIQPALWYPIECYDRLLCLLVEIEGGSEPGCFLRARGRKAAQRLAEAGIYAQLRGDSQAATLDLAQVKRTLSLWAAMVSFSQASAALESERPRIFRIDVSDAAKFPWVLRQANAGFMEGVFSGLAQRAVAVSIEGERADRFAYRVEVRG